MRNPGPSNPSPAPSNITIAVDAEINILERRLEKLREIRRLTVELDHARLPQAAKPTPAPAAPAVRRARRPPRTVDDIVDAVRDVLADEPASIKGMVDQLDGPKTPAMRATVQTALDQLNAVVVGRNRSGGPAYGIPTDPATGNDDPEAEQQLRQIVKEIVRRQVGCSDEEIQYQLRKRYGIDASLVHVHSARAERNGAAHGDATGALNGAAR